MVIENLQLIGLQRKCYEKLKQRQEIITLEKSNDINAVLFLYLIVLTLFGN